MALQEQNTLLYPNKTNTLNSLLARPHMIPFVGFRAKVNICIEKADYIVKTADNDLELEQVLKLRHDVFIREIAGRSRMFGVDVDKYDRYCDHLMIIDKVSGECVGCYRLNSSVYSTEFYSEKEFHLGMLKQLPGPLLEIGRACIRKEYRKSNMMGLIWEGLYRYVMKIGARQVFGCSSIMTVDPDAIAFVYYYLSHHKKFRDDLGIKPKGKYRIKDLQKKTEEVGILGIDTITEFSEELLPQLIKDYFKLGAEVCGEPALDREFKCIDVLTVLSLDGLNGGYLESRAGK